jgi:hypothetical protein
MHWVLIRRGYRLPRTREKTPQTKITVALHDELGRVAKEDEINQVFLLTRVMYKDMLGLHFKRRKAHFPNFRGTR